MTNMILDPDTLQKLQAALIDDMTSIQSRFPEGTKVTIVVRNADEDAANIIVTDDDDIPDVVLALEELLTDECPCCS